MVLIDEKTLGIKMSTKNAIGFDIFTKKKYI
jgi:hypothetical protein